MKKYPGDLEVFEELELAEPDTEVSESETPENISEPFESSIPGIPSDWLSLTNKIPFSAIITDPQMRIKWRNESFTQEFERNEQMLKKPLYSFFHSIDDEEKKSLSEVKLDGDRNTRSWKGRIVHNERTSDNFMANMLLFPLDMESPKNPQNYLGLVDDITAEYKKLLRTTFLSLLEASKLKDNDTGYHIDRVNRYSYLMAKRLLYMKDYEEVNNDFVDNIAFLAAMHDVGKIGTPDDILHKPGPLDDWEREVMKEHTKNGAFILSTYPNPMAKSIALSHHEKWDGSGYPYGLMENMIPLPARIVAIADVYDALRSKRSYKEPMTHFSTIEFMESQKGSHFDPNLMDIFIRHNKVFEAAFDELSD